MLRQALLVITLPAVAVLPAAAEPISFDTPSAPYGAPFAPSSSPFESFEWTPLDWGAFNAYGGDFLNVRRPVTPFHFFEEPAPNNGPDDEMVFFRAPELTFFEEPAVVMSFAAQPMSSQIPVPEPGTLLLIGLALLGASTQARRIYKQ